MGTLIRLKFVVSSAGSVMARYSSPKADSLTTVRGTATIARNRQKHIDNISLGDALFVTVSLVPSALALTAKVVGRTHARCDAFSRCAEGQTCNNGLVGVQNGDICCDAACGTCGGSGCADLLGGRVSSCLVWTRENYYRHTGANVLATSLGQLNTYSRQNSLSSV